MVFRRSVFILLAYIVKITSGAEYMEMGECLDDKEENVMCLVYQGMYNFKYTCLRIALAMQV